MKKYLLPQSGHFYKVNMHSHSTLSDGKQTPEELKEYYLANGYSAIAFTEHRILHDLSRLTDRNFVALTSFEYDVLDNTRPANSFYEGVPHTSDHAECVHINFYSPDPHDINMECFNPSVLTGRYAEYQNAPHNGSADFPTDFSVENINRVIAAYKSRGMLSVLNHPNWSLNTYPLYTSLCGLDGLEIANGGNDYHYVPYVYDQMSRVGMRLICVGGDDNHHKGNFFKSFTYIKADELSHDALFDALKAGNCYSSRGPEIYDLYVEDGSVHINCSDAVSILYNTVGRRKDGRGSGDYEKSINEAAFTIKPDDIYFRIDVRDKYGRCANTRTYFTDEL